MIRQKKTVFVVGAGASTNFSLPAGAQLKNDIANLMEYSLPDPRTVKGRFSKIFYQLKRAAEAKTAPFEDVNDALRAAEEIRAAMPLAQSIDNYLDAHRRDATTNVVGKMAICQAIVEREGRSNITSPDPSSIYNRFDFGRSENTWINAFLRKVTEGVPKADVATLFTDVAIVTFNYDRCIEQFLYYALQRYYRLSEQETRDALARLKIVHVYGKVGRLPWQSGNEPSIPYGDLSNADLFEAAKGMATFTELAANAPSRAEIASAFEGTLRVVFLGFSFQEQNVSVLPASPLYLDVYGTAKDMSAINLRVIENKLPAQFARVSSLALEAIGAESFIDNYWRVIE